MMPIHKVVTALWAPDVIWNADYEWSNGDKGAYMLYYSASSTWRRSADWISCSKTIEGPYSYADTVIYSGFTEKIRQMVVSAILTIKIPVWRN